MAALVTALSGASLAVLPPISASAATVPAPTIPAISATALKPVGKPAARSAVKAPEFTYYARFLVNTRPPHAKPGDSWVTYLALYDVKKNRVGDGSARCTAAMVTRQGVIAQCTRVLRTKAGQLTLLGMDDRLGAPPWTSTAAILGGTGRYAGMTGSARVTVTQRNVVFRIHPLG
ncbi:hypothetical protein DQ384_13910 [Sphaerisporangium album]|uniref:Dirigent protein n=1 Tax=Sphaerisporangium album TaxID=509200 RepID=A0A367FL91_9ACTN|nr:hypothetical protein [Sphaerisporangium album]RCG31034.1 hypothetical protein DQ384_13910 [Sphaerisporangium album]